MIGQQKMPCPACGNEIIFDTYMLMAGQAFSCGQCHASIGVATSSVPVVKDAMEKFEQIKAGGLKGENSSAGI
ncbi:MAG: hypothetical protein COA42_15060 [Alteromonadaceae bacterium]|nr:MAG: hypothetical protein COA42_15060 [Alteromonadaceae bacterium]